MIPNTPLGRYILVVVGEEPRSKAAMLSPVFDKEERDNDIIGSVTTLGGMTDLSPAILFERIGEISSALAKIDYSQESPVASTYVGDIPVSFQVLPESYGVEADPEPEKAEETGSALPPNFQSGDIGIAIRVGERMVVIAGDAIDLVGVLGDEAQGDPLVFGLIEHLLLTNPDALTIINKLAAEGGVQKIEEAADEDGDDEDTADFVIAVPVEDAADLVVAILDAADNIEISKLGEDDAFAGYLVTVPINEKADAIGAILDISPEISISAA